MNFGGGSSAVFIWWYFGVVLALVASVGLTNVLQVPFVFKPGIVIIAFLFSAVVRVVFGYFPAC